MLLETRNLTKQYGHYKAVNGVSLHIKKGAIYGFIGRNGAGKTTSFTNSTIVAIRLHLLTDKRRRYFLASLSYSLLVL